MKRQVNRLQQNRNVKGTMRGKPGENLPQGQRKGMVRGKTNFRNRRMDRKMDRTPSLTVGGDWELVEEYDLPRLLKLAANPPTAEDLMWCGHLDQYDDTYDKVTSKSARTLRRSENKTFYSVTSMEDPILERFAVDNLADVYATDAILAQLVAAPKSVYSWDIIVQKLNGMVFLDKRDDSNFDLLTVSETAQDPPAGGDEVEEYNHPDKLAIEASMINQNFSQQILIENDLERKKVGAGCMSVFMCVCMYVCSTCVDIFLTILPSSV
ncbi:hypothetical protein EON64_01060 [archaeon]|nr:MAG: hypothetical protein EON64_01060 [archaeon]